MLDLITIKNHLVSGDKYFYYGHVKSSLSTKFFIKLTRKHEFKYDPFFPEYRQFIISTFENLTFSCIVKNSRNFLMPFFMLSSLNGHKWPTLATLHASHRLSVERRLATYTSSLASQPWHLTTTPLETRDPVDLYRYFGSHES